MNTGGPSWSIVVPATLDKERKMSIAKHAVPGTLLAAGLLAAAAAEAGKPAAKTMVFTTQSPAAHDQLVELQRRIETFQFGPRNEELANKIVAADPAFALGVYYLSAVTAPPGNQKHLDKAVELSKTASDAERRFIEAMVLARGKDPAQAIEPLTRLTADYPQERLFFMLLGQNAAGLGRQEEAKAAFEKAIALDPGTPRAYAFVGNYYLMKGDYEKAREMYRRARSKTPVGVAPGQPTYATAFTHLYEGHMDEAISTLRSYLDEYKKTKAASELPEVFIWNSIARINLENGRLDEAMKAYEKGFLSVPGSSLPEDQKKIWLGRLHHGRGRTLARMGKHEEAWAEAATIRKMIDEGGEAGKPFEPAYHYLAGYLKLEKGDYPAAIEHLKQADAEDPFHKLLLARAYDKAGDKENARKAYEGVVNSPQNGLDRALAYREAKARLSAM
jgi:tetratricopeptide (TPR) repeat protein